MSGFRSSGAMRHFTVERVMIRDSILPGAESAFWGGGGSGRSTYAKRGTAAGEMPMRKAISSSVLSGLSLRKYAAVHT